MSYMLGCKTEGVMVGLTAWIQISVPSPTSCVTSCVTFLPSVPQFPPPVKWGYEEFLPHGMVVRIKWVMHREVKNVPTCGLCHVGVWYCRVDWKKKSLT